MNPMLKFLACRPSASTDVQAKKCSPESVGIFDLVTNCKETDESSLQFVYTTRMLLFYHELREISKEFMTISFKLLHTSARICRSSAHLKMKFAMSFEVAVVTEGSKAHVTLVRSFASVDTIVPQRLCAG